MYDILKRKCTDEIARCNYYINEYAETPIERALCNGKIQAYTDILKQIKHNEEYIQKKNKTNINKYTFYQYLKRL